MAAIRLLDVAHAYGAATTDWALKPLNAVWQDGGAYALLGPSGCGKTTLLNIMSGLIEPTRGSVLFDDRDMTRLPPEDRNIAQVFQFPIVYETMTVRENLAFPLRNRGWPTARIRERVRDVADILDLTGELPRRARGLPAELKQRLSLGRGLVRPDVAAVLFDEPLTVIDPHVKWLLRRKLKQIHRQLELTLVYVTHDQTEALTFADRVVVMSQGEILQTGSPEELFEEPAHRFVGHFIGSPGMNFVTCEWNGGAASLGGMALECASRSPPGDHVALELGIRPEYVEVRTSPGPNCIPARLVSLRDEGTRAIAQLAIAGQTLNARLARVPALSAEDPLYVRLPADRCALYADGRRVA